MITLRLPSLHRAFLVGMASLMVFGLGLEAKTTKRRRRVVTTASLRRPAAITPRQSMAPAGPIVRGGPWTEPTYADSTLGDFIDGDDLTIRKAAVEALGPYNGSVVV